MSSQRVPSARVCRGQFLKQSLGFFVERRTHPRSRLAQPVLDPEPCLLDWIELETVRRNALDTDIVDLAQGVNFLGMMSAHIVHHQRFAGHHGQQLAQVLQENLLVRRTLDAHHHKHWASQR